MQTGDIQQLASYLAAIVDSSDDAIIAKDLSGTITAWNRAAEAMFGYSAEEAIGRPIAILAAPGVTDEMPLILAQIRNGQAVAHYETVRRRKDGREIFVSLTVSPIRDATGCIVGASKIVRDITERRWAEKELRQAHAALLEAHNLLELRVLERTAKLADTNKELEARNGEVETFVYVVSHDLRTPLVNLQGFATELELSCEELRKRLATEGPTPEDRRRVQAILNEDIPGSLHYISASTHKFQRLIDALLRLSRYGRQEYRWEELDLNLLVQATVDSIRRPIADSGGQLAVARLPVAYGDATAVGQVFSNLIGNAIKYLRPGEPGRIEIGGEMESGEAHCWVSDNGAGLPASAKQRLFQVFQRFHPQLASGEGMGLAVVKRIVEQHGGRVWADSEEGAGTTFHFTLPGERPGELPVSVNNT